MKNFSLVILNLFILLMTFVYSKAKIKYIGNLYTETNTNISLGSRIHNNCGRVRIIFKNIYFNKIV
jgi:hypothetical protein